MRRMLSSKRGRDGIGHFAQRQMCRRQRHAHAATGQHHHHQRCMRLFGEEFGVSGKGNARIIDDALVHGCGDHAGEFAGQAALYCTAQGFQHIRGIGGIELSGLRGMRQGNMQHAQLAVLARIAGRVVVQLNVDAELRGTLLQQRLVGDHHQRLFMPRQLQAEIGADSGRFACGDGEGAAASIGVL